MSVKGLLERASENLESEQYKRELTRALIREGYSEGDHFSYNPDILKEELEAVLGDKPVLVTKIYDRIEKCLMRNVYFRESLLRLIDNRIMFFLEKRYKKKFGDKLTYYDLSCKAGFHDQFPEIRVREDYDSPELKVSLRLLKITGSRSDEYPELYVSGRSKEMSIPKNGDMSYAESFVTELLSYSV